MIDPLAAAPSRFSRRELQGLLIVMIVAWFSLFLRFPALLFFVGVNHLGLWFLDSYALLAASDAHRLGRDPYLANHLDYLNRPHMYSHWWLNLDRLGLTRADNAALGTAFVVAFVVAALCWLRPRRLIEVGWYFLVLGSPAVLLAADRANNDLVVFAVLAAVVPCVLSPHRLVRAAAGIPIALATGLKFYPAIAVVVLFDGWARRGVRLRLLVALTALAAVALDVAPDYLRVRSQLPRANGLTTFGAVNLLEALGWSGAGAALASVAFVAAIAMVVWRRRVFEGWRPPRDDPADWLGFVLGASLITACFFVGTNYSYRLVFAVWMAPLLLRLPDRVGVSPGVRRLLALTRWLLLLALWMDALVGSVLTLLRPRVPGEKILAWADRFFLWEQPVTWLFIGCLVAFLTQYALDALRGETGGGVFDLKLPDRSLMNASPKR